MACPNRRVAGTSIILSTLASPPQGSVAGGFPTLPAVATSRWFSGQTATNGSPAGCAARRSARRLQARPGLVRTELRDDADADADALALALNHDHDHD